VEGDDGGNGEQRAGERAIAVSIDSPSACPYSGPNDSRIMKVSPATTTNGTGSTCDP